MISSLIGSLLTSKWFIGAGVVVVLVAVAIGYHKITLRHAVNDAILKTNAEWVVKEREITAANEAKIEAINNLLADSIAEATRLNEQATKEKADLLDEIAKAHLSDSPAVSAAGMRILKKAR
jgi:hypothetical protein